MKKLALALILSISGGIFAQDTTKVLFIGNSITYFNNMPQTFESIANSKGDQTQVTVYAPGGTGFVHHVVDPNVYTKFRQGDWDYVVLQPGSSESREASFTKEVTLGRAKILKDSILKYNPCAEILYYEISYGIWGTTPSDVTYYDSVQNVIKSNVTYWADSTELFFSPAGECMRTAWHNDVNTILWGGTGNIHPNPRGSYIIALSFYASIFQKQTFGTSIYGTLTQQEAEDYQTMVDTIVLDHLSDWRINTYSLTNAFNFTVNNNEVIFTNLSQNTDSVLWDFGDGTFSTDFNPTHTYNSINTYNTTLSVFKNGCQVDSTTQISINSLSLNESEQYFNIYPNPASDFVIIKSSIDKLTIQIFDNNGRKVIDTNNNKIDVSSLQNGIYFIRIITSNKNSFNKKLIINH